MVGTIIIYMSIGVFSKRVGKRTNLITLSIHPNIHITPGILINGLGYITALPCPFKIQQLYPESFPLIIYSHRSLIQNNIALHDFLVYAKPTHQQFQIRCCILK